MTPTRSYRLAYIDWMRGLACLLMFQTHCYDSWLNPAARKSTFFMRSQLLGTLPAPLFLFLAGTSVALVIGKLQKSEATPNTIALTIIRRGAEILGLGLLFRLQEYLIAFPWAPWSDLLRVDILNTIGVSIMLLGGTFWILSATRLRSAAMNRDYYPPWVLGSAAFLACALISLATPLIWTIWRPRWLPWPIESYIDGVHNIGTPQSWLFPIFPWTGFAFAGFASAVFFSSAWGRKREVVNFIVAGWAGILMIAVGKWFDRRPQLYPVSDFWHTSPNFFLIRVGILLVILFVTYAWCRWGLGGRGFSPVAQLGQTSLLVYWVHIEFVYGRVSILKKHETSVGGASVGLLVICVAMLVLSLIRTYFKSKGVHALSWIHFPMRARTQRAGQ